MNTELKGRGKLYVADIKDRLNPVLDRSETYPHHNLYFVQSDGWDLKVLGGLLLSDVAQFFIECYEVRMKGGYLRFQAQYLRCIRVPGPREVTAGQAERLRRAFRGRDAEEATAAALEVYRIEGFLRRCGVDIDKRLQEAVESFWTGRDHRVQVTGRRVHRQQRQQPLRGGHRHGD